MRNVAFYLVRSPLPEGPESYWIPYQSSSGEQPWPEHYKELLQGICTHLKIQASPIEQADLIIAFAGLGACLDRGSLENLWITKERAEELREAGKVDRLLRIHSVASDKQTLYYTPLPILVIGTENIMLSDDSKDLFDKYLAHSLRNGNPIFRFWDSSIWHRYTSLHPVENCKDRLSTLYEELCDYHRWNMYRTIVAQESLEFQGRILRQSYVKEIEGGHWKRVTPFIFRSESFFHQKAKGLIEKGEIDQHGYQLGALLIDDYFKRKLRIKPSVRGNDTDPSQQEEGGLNKIELIENILGSYVDILNKKKKDKSGRYISKAKKWMKNFPMADVLIIDYFMGMGETDPDEQYGHQLLKDLVADDDNGKKLRKKKPFDKFWIIPISAFENAWKSHLQAMGTNNIDQIMRIADVSDPITAPQFFFYTFISFLLLMRNELGVPLSTVREKLVNGKGLKENFELTYPLITKMTANYSRLEQLKNSVFAKSILKAEKPFNRLRNFCLHLQRIVELVLYDVEDNWPILYDEYQILKKIYDEMGTEQTGDWEDFFKKLRVHIQEIQENF